jgi:integrase
MHARLASVGLVKPRENSAGAKLVALFDSYIDGRTDAKPTTLRNLRQARRYTQEYFGKDRALTSITKGDADEFRRHLLHRGGVKGRPLAENTVRTHCKVLKQLFEFFIDKELIRKSPFANVESHVGSSKASRISFVSRDVADKVMDSCPDAQWRLIFALARYGGLRTPSETKSLKWGDVDFERGRIRVPSPKTEHLEGGESRMIPLFPELRQPLMEVFEAAEPGTELVITRYRGQNLRTGLERIIKRAGVEPWPKLFQNLRSTRQTELARTFPAHVVCGWLDNTEAVANEHYFQVTDSDFEKAASVGGAESDVSGVKHGQGKPRYVRKDTHQADANRPVFPSDAELCGPVQDYAIPPRGVEPLSSG